jgi:hypothetical protein
LPDKNTDNKFTKPNDVKCGVGKGWHVEYSYKVYNIATDIYEYYQRYHKEGRNCVLKAGTNEAPGKFIRFFEMDNGKHVPHCFAPNGNSLQCGEYDTLSRAKIDEVNYILNGQTAATPVVDSEGGRHYHKAPLNDYPLSKKQVHNGINQLSIKEFYESSKLPSNNELKGIVERNYILNVLNPLLRHGMLKSRKEILVDAFKDAIKVILQY